MLLSLAFKGHVSNGLIHYTAISHVWSDGLGNRENNGIRRCQLDRIARILKNLKERKDRYAHPGAKYTKKSILGGGMKNHVYFWLDTLCIPVKVPADSITVPEAKNLAIRHTTPIFEAADEVLVIDAELQQLALRSHDDEVMTTDETMRNEEYITARILGCKWWQRAWTYSESALARNCHFLVAGETTIELGELVSEELMHTDKHKAEVRKSMYKMLRKRMIREHLRSSDEPEGTMAPINAFSTSARWESKPLFDPPLKLHLAGPLNENRKQTARAGMGKLEESLFLKTRAAQFCDAWNNLLDRSATKPGDPIIILANILDLNAATIARIKSPEERLPAVIRSSRELPLGLLFNMHVCGQICRTPADLWIPSEITGSPVSGSAVMVRDEYYGHKGPRIELEARHKSLLVLIAKPKILLDTRNVLAVFEDEQRNQHHYIIEISTWSSQNLPAEYLHRIQESYAEGDAGCSLLLLDQSAGTATLNGYSARGSSLTVLNEVEGETVARYGAPFTAWTLDRW